MLPSGAPAFVTSAPQRTPPTEPIQNVFQQYALQKEKQQRQQAESASRLPPQTVVQQIFPQQQFVQTIPQAVPISNQITNHFLCALASQSQPAPYVYNQDPNALIPCRKCLADSETLFTHVF